MLTSRQIIVANVRSLMAGNSRLSDAQKLAKNCYWLSGRKAGKKVAKRTINYLLQTTGDLDLLPSPTAQLIDALAAVFEVEAWLLLVSGFRPESPPELLMRGSRQRGNGERPPDHAVATKTNPKRRPKSGTRRA